jgi:hypothetical protein
MFVTLVSSWFIHSPVTMLPPHRSLFKHPNYRQLRSPTCLPHNFVAPLTVDELSVMILHHGCHSAGCVHRQSVRSIPTMCRSDARLRSCIDAAGTHPQVA